MRTISVAGRLSSKCFEVLPPSPPEAGKMAVLVDDCDMMMMKMMMMKMMMMMMKMMMMMMIFALCICLFVWSCGIYTRERQRKIAGLFSPCLRGCFVTKVQVSRYPNCWGLALGVGALSHWLFGFKRLSDEVLPRHCTRVLPLEPS